MRLGVFMPDCRLSDIEVETLDMVQVPSYQGNACQMAKLLTNFDDWD